MKKGIILLTVLLLLLYPFIIFADGSTYSIITGSETYSVTLHYNGNNTDFTKTRYFEVGTSSSEVRGFFLRGINNNGCAWYFISLDPFTYTITSGVSFSNAQYYNTGGYQFYYYFENTSQYSSYVVSSNIAVVDGSRDLVNTGYYYTFGDGAIGDTPVFGDLANLGFYTKFTNSQQSNISQMALNKDIITWDKYQDTAGNDLNDINLRVDIQAATIDYEANTKSDLLNQTINDMVTGAWSDLITISPNVGTYETTWQNVASALWGTNNITINFWNSLFNVFDSAQGVFYKNGWIYRIRHQ